MNNRFYLFFLAFLFPVCVFAATSEPLKDKYQEETLCTIRRDLYLQACAILDIKDTAIVNTVDINSLTSFKTKVKQLSAASQDNTSYQQSLQHLRIIADYSKVIEGQDLKTDYDNIKKNINNVFSYIASLPSIDSLSIIKIRDSLLQRAAYAIIECPAHKGILDSLSGAVFASIFSNMDNTADRNCGGNNSADMTGTDVNTESYVANPSSRDVKQSKSHSRNLPFFILIIFAIGAIYYYFNYFRKREKEEQKISSQRSETPRQRLDDLAKHDGISPPEAPIETTAHKVENKIINTPASVHDNKVVVYDDEFITLVGGSVIGKNHLAMNLPCQDSCGYENIGNGWGIAVTSDGAGSAEHSEVGSKIIILRSIEYFKKLIASKGWISGSYIPTEAEWTQVSYQVVKAVRDDLEKFAQTKNVEIKSLNATLITVIHTPFGLLTCHVGDGRSGYKNKNGEWLALTTPHKGEEANQTIFVTSDFWSVPNYVMSGVMVPESHVIIDEVVAFTLMSDGCEATSWLYNQYDQSLGKYYDPNKPFSRFFDPLIQSLEIMHTENETLEHRIDKWTQFLTEGGKFSSEPDDKTMILGVILK